MPNNYLAQLMRLLHCMPHLGPPSSIGSTKTCAHPHCTNGRLPLHPSACRAWLQVPVRRTEMAPEVQSWFYWLSHFIINNQFNWLNGWPIVNLQSSARFIKYMRKCASSCQATVTNLCLYCMCNWAQLNYYYHYYYCYHLWPLCRTTCISRHPHLRTGGFWWSNVLLPACPY